MYAFRDRRAHFGRVAYLQRVECRRHVSRRVVYVVRARGVDALRFGIAVIVFKWRSCRRQFLTCPPGPSRRPTVLSVGGQVSRVCVGYFKQCDHTYISRGGCTSTRLSRGCRRRRWDPRACMRAREVTRGLRSPESAWRRPPSSPPLLPPSRANSRRKTYSTTSGL